MTLHAMIDIETLGLVVPSPIFEVSATLFSEREIFNSLKLNLDLLDVVLTTGFVPSRDTVIWWQQQEYDPRTSGPRLFLKPALLQLNDFCKDAEFVWANSPAFDLVMLSQHYMKANVSPFWNHRMEMDYRTIRTLHKKLCADAVISTAVAGQVHDSSYDAMYQTEMLQFMMKDLKLVRDM